MSKHIAISGFQDMKRSLLSIFCIISIIGLPVLAKSVYVFDTAKIWSRTGPSNEYKVYIKVSPGTKLEVLAADTVTGFTQVRDSQQREFWMKTEYLTSSPTANIRLNEALTKNKKLSTEHQSAVQGLERKIKTMEPLEEINQNLQSKIAAMQIELDQVKQSNMAISSRFNREVYFAGGLTIIVGILFGWLFGIRGRKRNDAWS